ncbi:MAG TPA: phage portal protein [Candidatus Brocadiia bacterium]|nr:phage portal protein [Candidatus Brocadiia bacterium]
MSKSKTQSRVNRMNAARMVRHVREAQRAYYDAAAASRLTDKLFSHATAGEIDTFINADWATVCARALYELRMNGYARGWMFSLADHIVGSGPTLQMLTDDDKFNTEIEDRISDWFSVADRGGRMDFGALLRLGVYQWMGCGDMLQQFVTDETADDDVTPVKLRIQPIHPVRLNTPWTGLPPGSSVRYGVEVDSAGKALAYYIQKRDARQPYTLWDDYDKIPARYVAHLFVAEEAGQTRAMPWLTPSLPLLAQLRRYSKATLTAAESAAEMNIILSASDKLIELLADLDEDFTFDVPDSMEDLGLAPGGMIATPPGYVASQMKSEQPSTQYPAAKKEFLSEGARPLGLPYNRASGSSEGYNYSSGRLDMQEAQPFIENKQTWLANAFCNRVLRLWLREAHLIPGFLSHPRPDLVFRPGRGVPCQWYWPGIKHVDPQKEAAGRDINLRNATDTLADAWSREGADWKRKMEQRCLEAKAAAEFEKRYGVKLSWPWDPSSTARSTASAENPGPATEENA